MVAFANSGHLMLSVEQSPTRPTDELIYSLNKGYDWHRMLFSPSEAVRIVDVVSSSVVVDSSSSPPRFIVLATSPRTGALRVFKIEASRQESAAAAATENSSDESNNDSIPSDVNLPPPPPPPRTPVDECTRKCFSFEQPTKVSLYSRVVKHFEYLNFNFKSNQKA